MESGLGIGEACRALPTKCARDTSGLESLVSLVRFEVNEVIYHNLEQVQYWYRVVTGAARKCSVMVDGRRHIVDFLLPDDVFGFGAQVVHHFSTQAISTGTTIARYPRHAAERLAESDPRVSRWIRQKAFSAISRLQARTLLLGHTSALARVSAFLLEWMDRCNQPTGTTICLPMSRYDIADYLAIAVETVSRVLTLLRTQHVIVFRSKRRLSICDRRALELAMLGTDDV